MSAPDVTTSVLANRPNHGHDLAAPAHSHGSRQTYLIGFALSAVLTVIPFWLVMTGAIDAQATGYAVIALAVVQILVHTSCFLHVNRRAEGGWTMIALIFTSVILLITIAGSLWIMYHLNSNMMPMDAAGSGELR
ncbi:cytochrome o ubiquinol oxidase subunit IV [Sphingomonas sp.]|uniref:cytochrome o ubiquinol oxidase subunit IV n=1 Tax=Sphingomonas sp. TaxID=28214 RepID=UPI00325FC029